MRFSNSLLENCRGLIRGYLARYPGECFGLHHLLRQVQTQGSTVFDRKNMDGHVTASVLVISDDLDSVLLIHHGAYRTWIPPGGHVEGDALTLFDSARREVLEETGMELSQTTASLLDIDTHPIPARPEKEEAAHWHHDFMFAVKAPADFKPRHQESELLGAEWRPLRSLATDPVDRNRCLYQKVMARIEGFEGID